MSLLSKISLNVKFFFVVGRSWKKLENWLEICENFQIRLETFDTNKWLEQKFRIILFNWFRSLSRPRNLKKIQNNFYAENFNYFLNKITKKKIRYSVNLNLNSDFLSLNINFIDKIFSFYNFFLCCASSSPVNGPSK